MSVRFPDLFDAADVDTGKGSGAALEGTRAAFGAALAAYADLGIVEVIVSLEPFTKESVRRFLEISAPSHVARAPTS